MRTQVLTMCVALGLASGLAAQTQPGTSESRPAPGKAKTGLSITGCLHEAAEQPGLFVLVPTGGAGAKAGAPSSPLYRLAGSGGADLTAHVGHQVQITGTLTGRSQPPRQSGAEGMAKTPASESSAALRDAPELNVVAFRHVADVCPPASGQ